MENKADRGDYGEGGVGVIRGTPALSMYLMAQGYALLQIMHTSVSARDSRR